MSEVMAEKIAKLAQDIQQFKSLDEWWTKCVYTPIMKSFWPEMIALLVIECVIIHTHNWVAALLCFGLMVSKIYNTVSSLTHNLLHGFLVLQNQKSINEPPAS